MLNINHDKYKIEGSFVYNVLIVDRFISISKFVSEKQFWVDWTGGGAFT